jgi:pyruvate dehydrogenase E2 component (dihydrolipoamide acetyltransferase)
MDGDAVKPLTGMRKTIATRMLDSHIQIPPVTLDTKADVTGLLIARKKQNEKHKVSINDYVVQACAQALSEMPQMNISFAGDSLLFHSHINIGIAVALDSGLIVPVIRNADRYSLEGIADTVKELAGKAKAGKLLPDEYSGGTFTISNLGKYGITFFTPIINQPESMILGVCAVEKVLKMEDGHLYNRDIMGLSLTFDHRAHDGASAAVFLQRIVGLLESVGQGGTDGK